MHGLIEPFYDAAPKGQPNVIARGEIYEDQPMYLPAPWGLQVTRVNPLDDSRLTYELRGRTADIFNHPPITRLKPPNGEALVVAKAKWKRPVIVLAGEGFELIAGMGKARSTDTFLCAPVYGGDQFSDEMRRRVRAYEYPNLFYLPESKLPLFSEGLVRFDHMQAIRRAELRNRKAAKLSAEALVALEEWLFFYVSGRLQKDSLIQLYRAEELQKLQS